MSMKGSFVTDLSNSIQKQSLAGLVDAHDPLALFIAADPANPLNEHTMIEAITYRLHQPLTSLDQKALRNGFHAMAFLADHPSLLLNKSAVRDPYAYFQKHQDRFSDQQYQLENRAEASGSAYQDANPQLDSDQGVMDPWTALDHYLSKGMEQGLSLY